MKKQLSLILAAVVPAGLTACGTPPFLHWSTPVTSSTRSPSMAA